MSDDLTVVEKVEILLNRLQVDCREKNEVTEEHIVMLNNIYLELYEKQEKGGC